MVGLVTVASKTSGLLAVSSLTQNDIQRLSAVSFLVGLACMAILLGLAVYLRRRRPTFARSLFMAFALFSVLTTAVIAGSGSFLMNAAPTDGPTERQASLEVWACGQRLSFQAPSTPQYASIGTTAYHLYSNGLLEYKGTPLTKADMDQFRRQRPAPPRSPRVRCTLHCTHAAPERMTRV